MPALILVSSAFLAFAVTIVLLALGYQPATLVELFSSLPLLQQIAWVVRWPNCANRYSARSIPPRFQPTLYERPILSLRRAACFRSLH